MTTLNDLLALAPNSSVVLNRHLVAFAGSLEAGLLLGQLLYWTPRAKLEGGWIAKTDKEFAQELCLSAYAIRRAVEAIKALGIVEIAVRKFNGNPTNHYRLVSDVLVEKWTAYLKPELFSPVLSDSQDRNCETGKTKSRVQKNVLSKSQVGNGDSGKSSTTKTTSTTTATSTSASPASAPRGRKKEPKDTYKLQLHFMAAWKKRYGRAYYWLGGQDGKHAQRILAACGGDLTRATVAVDAFLASDDAFYLKNSHKVGLLLNNINTHLGQNEVPLDDQLLVGGQQWKGVDATDEDLIALGLATPEQLKRPMADDRRRANADGEAA